MKKYDKIYIMGDFNLLFVNWEGKFTGNKGEEIKSKIQDTYLQFDLHPFNDLIINGEKVERVHEYKYLGTIIDDKLNFVSKY